MKGRSARPGILLLVLLLTIYYAAVYSRTVFPPGGPPAFFLEQREGLTVMLGEGFPQPGIHQFSDGITILDVINMTDVIPSPALSSRPSADLFLRSGEVVDFVLDGPQVVGMRRKWMSGSHRITLGIPLHPDRMSRADWQALPGIGPRLALRIEEDRQLNGDFGAFEALDRVSGIGPGRLASWREFFQPL